MQYGANEARTQHAQPPEHERPGLQEDRQEDAYAERPRLLGARLLL